MITQNMTINDVGPINKLAIQFPPGGGVTVLKGRNGTGKSTALSAAETLVRGNGKLQTRDAAKGSGRVDGFGATLILGRKVTRAGEIEVASLEGKLNIADLVQPPLKDPAAADRQRIKALVSLTGVEPSVELFATVLDHDLLPYVSAATWADKDLLEVAAKAKRDLELNARHKENEASLLEGQAQARRESAKDVDIEQPCDGVELSAAHIKASGNLSALQERAKAANESAQQLVHARTGLAKITNAYTGPSVEEADKANDLAKDAYLVSSDAVSELRNALAKAEAQAKQNISTLNAAENALNAAEEHAQTVAGYETILDSTATKAPAITEITAAQTRVNEACQAVEQGAIIRRAKYELHKANAHQQQATAAAEIAARIRQAACQIDDVLSKAIAGQSIFVRDGRMYTHTEARGETLFSELSQGERITQVFDIVAPIVGEGGLIVLPQEFWEGLDPANQSHIIQEAATRKLNVLAAEATDGELRAETFGGAE